MSLLMRVISEIRDLGADTGQLDILVQDQLCQTANRINNNGTQAQVKFLLKRMKSKELLESVRHEMYMLRQHHMKMQNKLIPKRNVKVEWAPKKKKRRIV